MVQNDQYNKGAAHRNIRETCATEQSGCFE